MMMQPRYDYDYDSFQRQNRGPSPRSARRHDPYGYGRWSEQRSEVTYGHLPQPTPIHEPEVNNEGSRKRIGMACARCRKRKIKCSGDPKNGSGCGACRAAGADLNNCVFTRVGTDRQFDLIPMPEYIPAIQSPGYGPMDGAGRSLSSQGLTWREPHTPSYSYDQRASFPTTSLPQYTLDVVDSITIPVTSSVSDGSGYGSLWTPTTTSGRTNPPLGGFYDSEPAMSYEPMYPLQRTATTSSDQYSPLNLTSMHATLPPPPERRLPAPKFVGTTMAPGSPDVHNTMRGRLASLSISGSQNRDTVPWSMETQPQSQYGSGIRQPSVQGLPHPTVVLPSVSRGFMNPDIVSAADPQDGGALGYLYPSSTGIPDLSLTTGVGPSYYANSALPPLTAPMLQSMTRYPSISILNAPLPRITADELPPLIRQSSDPNAATHYNWTTVTDHKLQTGVIEDDSPSLTGNQRFVPLSSTPLQHPQPQVPHQARSLDRLTREAPPPVPSSRGHRSKGSQRQASSPNGSKKPKARGSKGSLN